ncbi:hypothetical protein [Mycobacterium sp.]|uniref:hypothetical protein n=1 Tax=Mycobacterium sp. TaxID=1785 RepID=UPI003D13D495
MTETAVFGQGRRRSHCLNPVSEVHFAIAERRIGVPIDSFIERGSADLKSEFAGPLTIQTIAEQIGVPDERLSEMERVAHNLLQALDQPANAEPGAVDEFSSFAMELMQERRRNPQDDTLTVLAQVEVTGRELDAEKAMAYFSGFLIAGQTPPGHRRRDCFTASARTRFSNGGWSTIQV